MCLGFAWKRATWSLNYGNITWGNDTKTGWNGMLVDLDLKARAGSTEVQSGSQGWVLTGRIHGYGYNGYGFLEINLVWGAEHRVISSGWWFLIKSMLVDGLWSCDSVTWPWSLFNFDPYGSDPSKNDTWYMHISPCSLLTHVYLLDQIFTLLGQVLISIAQIPC